MGDEGDAPEIEYTLKYEGDDTVYKFVSKDGTAKVTYANKDTYEGDFKDGKKHGKGTYMYNQGASQYIGDWVAGKKQGQGILKTAKGIYTGDFLENKYHGKGSYEYLQNGDTYTGEFRNGLKHGLGTYIYKATGQVLSAEWINGQPIYGTLRTGDDCHFTGTFTGGRPSGPGSHVFAGGFSTHGTYDAANKWVSQKFTKPSLYVTAPEAKEADAQTKLFRQLDKAVLKMDHFDAIYRLKKVYEGVPNYRKVEGFNIFGAGQPTVAGFKACLNALKEQGIEKVVSINLRSDPIVYVNDWSLTPRDPLHLNEAIRFPASLPVGDLETRLVNRIRLETKAKNGAAHYYKDVSAENPADRKNQLELEDVKDAEKDIRGVSAVYESLKEEELNVELVRIALDERLPNPDDIDKLVAAIRGVETSAGVLFNCQMGKARTTLGMVLATLIRRTQDTESKEELPASEYDASQPNKRMGQYAIVMNLVQTLKDGAVLKAQVDDAVDRCSAIQHMRESILYTHEMCSKETDQERKDYWSNMARDFLERYFFLLAFNAYLKETAAQEWNLTFAQWHKDHPEIFSLLGTKESGPLAQFAWE